MSKVQVKKWRELNTVFTIFICKVSQPMERTSLSTNGEKPTQTSLSIQSSPAFNQNQSQFKISKKNVDNKTTTKNWQRPKREFNILMSGQLCTLAVFFIGLSFLCPVIASKQLLNYKLLQSSLGIIVARALKASSYQIWHIRQGTTAYSWHLYKATWYHSSTV